MPINTLLLNTKFRLGQSGIKGIVRPYSSLAFQISPLAPAYALLITKIAYGGMESGTLTEKLSCTALVGTVNLLTKDRLVNPIELTIPVFANFPLICQYGNITSFEQTYEATFEYIRVDNSADYRKLTTALSARESI